MNSTALLLVLGGALCHAVWNLLSKKAGGGLHFVWLFGLVSIVLTLPFGIAAWWANPQQLSPLALAGIAGSAAIHAVYSLVLQRGYRLADFSVVYPLARGTGPLFSIVGAIALLGEMPSLTGWAGIAAILVGIALISGIHLALRTPTPRTRAGLHWGSLTGLSIAAYTLLDGWAIKVLGLAPMLFYSLCLVARSVMLTPLALRDPADLRREWQRNRRLILAVGALSPAAYALTLFALTRAPLSYVAPVRELSMLIGVLIGSRLLSESLTPSRLMGTACMVAGIAVLAVAP